MIQYVATINVPGYLPMDDEPPTFDTISEAWNYLADERKDSELMSEYPDGTPLSDTYRNLLHMATIPDPQTGSIYGATPGYEGDHDLGLAYSVDTVDDGLDEYGNAYALKYTRL